MTDPLDSLGAQVNRRVELRFTDGEIVQAKLLAVDPRDHEDLTYEVLSVIRRGTPAAKGTEVGQTVIAKLNELEHWRPIG